MLYACNRLKATCASRKSQERDAVRMQQVKSENNNTAAKQHRMHSDTESAQQHSNTAALQPVSTATASTAYSHTEQPARA